MMIHQAGPFVDGLQVCRRCGHVLTDYRGAMVPDGTPPLMGFAVGASIEVDDPEFGPKYSGVTTEAPDCPVLSDDELKFFMCPDD